MRIYAAAGFGDLKDLARTRYPEVLIAYEPTRSARSRAWPYVPPRLFLDSGAFAAWSRGQAVDVERFADWALSYVAWHPDVIVANLDVIPGTPGVPATRREQETAVARGMENADALRARGLLVAEAWHRYEPVAVLERLCARRQPGELLAFGGLVPGRDSTGKIAHCDAGFNLLHNLYGSGALPPVHGFGLGPDSALGVRYPWFSVDCSTWLGPRKFGNVVDGSGRRLSDRGVFDAPLAMDTMLGRWTRMGEKVADYWARSGVAYDVSPSDA